MLKNKVSFENKNFIPEPKTKILVIYSEVDERRKIPYSLLFDLLTYFNDPSLSDSIKSIFNSRLPKLSDYHNEIDLWVDLESIGEITALLAKEISCAIVHYLEGIQEKIHLIVKLHSKMSRENQLLIHYLQSTTQIIKIIYRNVHINEKTLLYESDHFYLDWFCQSDEPSLHFDKNINNVLFYAWRCAELGAEEVGFRILEEGYLAAANSYLQQIYLLQLQFMRIATQYYSYAAYETRVIPEVHKDLLDLFYLTKAWGCVLSRELIQAEYYFHRAGISMEYVPSDLNSLYRLNIYALFKYLTGFTEDAFRLENKIKKSISVLNKSRPQISYINCINMARLHRYQNQFDESKQFYDQAFATLDDIKSETDFVYTNSCYGMLYEKQKNWETSLRYWLKAAMHWLVMENREALGWRAVRAIAIPNFKPRDLLNTDKITLGFVEKIQLLAQCCNIAIFHKLPSCSFLSIEKDEETKKSCALGINELSIIARKTKDIPKVTSENEARLKSIVVSLLAHWLGFSADCFNTFLVDRRNNEIPRCFSDLLVTCLLYSIPELIYEGKYYFLNEEIQKILELNLVVDISPSILEVQCHSIPYFVKHKRYYPKNYLSTEEFNLLMALQSQHSYSILKNSFSLEYRKILHLMKRGLISIKLNNLDNIFDGVI